MPGRTKSFIMGLMAGSPQSMTLGHPENEGSMSMADGMPVENQYGALHTAKNDSPEEHWHGPSCDCDECQC